MFRLPAPTSYRAKDGSGRRIIIEHRVGKSVCFYTKPVLMNKVGLEKEWRDMMKDVRRKVLNAKDAQQLSDSFWGTQSKRLAGMLTAYRKFLTKFYESQDLLPCLTYVPVNTSDMGLFIQALIDRKTSALVAGEPEDAALWNEVTAIREKAHVDSYQRAIDCAKALMKLPSVNKDIQYRMNLIAKEQIPSGGLGGLRLLGQEGASK